MIPYGWIAILLVCTGIFFYDIWRIFRIFNNQLSHRIILGIAFILASIVCISLLWWNQSNIQRIDILQTLASRLLVGAFLLMFWLAITHLISHRYKISPFIICWCIGIIRGIGTILALKTTITNLTITSEKIQEEKKILVVSDIHVDFILSEIHLKKIKNTIKEEKPDFVLLLGDLFNKAHPWYEKFYEIFKDETTPMFAVVGNHDIMWDKELIYQIPNLSPINILTNEATEIDGINLVGIMDKSNRNQPLEKLLDNISLPNNNQFTIFMTHQPITRDKIEKYPFDLELAWHTHRGQFYGMRKVVELVNGYGYGEYHYKDKIAFVTQGIGTWGLPFRLGTRSEIVMLHLLPEN